MVSCLNDECVVFCYGLAVKKKGVMRVQIDCVLNERRKKSLNPRAGRSLKPVSWTLLHLLTPRITPIVNTQGQVSHAQIYGCVCVGVCVCVIVVMCVYVSVERPREPTTADKSASGTGWACLICSAGLLSL